MLVLSRCLGEAIVIDEEIQVTVVEIRGDRIRLGICAPKSVRVDRQEVHERKAAEEKGLSVVREAFCPSAP